MKKPLLSLIFIIISCHVFAQTFFEASSNPGDNGSLTSTTVAVTPPTGVQLGDLVVIYAHYRHTSGTLTISNAGGQTWTSEDQSDGTDQRTRIFWCRFNGTWAANPVVSRSATTPTGTRPLSAIMYVFRPTNSASLWSKHMGPTSANSTNSTVSITGLTTTVPNTVTMAFWASSDDNTWGATTATGWNNTSTAQYRNTGGSQQSHTAAYNIRATAGTVANVSKAQTANGTDNTRTSIISWFEVPPPPNDNCANATTIKPASSCISGGSLLTGQTLNGATVEGSGITSCGSTASQDVWYKFVAPGNYPTIKVTNLGSGWGGSGNVRIQLLSGDCGSLTQVACASGATLTVGSPGLTVGNTYYVRIHKNNTNVPLSNWGFDICITAGSSRMNEVFKQTTLSGPNLLNDPWEVTYGPDNYLWVTEAKGYKVNRIDPVSGTKTEVLNISQNSTFLPVADRTFNCQFDNANGAQGGLAGLALHPKFLDPVSPQNYVYISYIYSKTSSTVFTNRLVRFTYNTGTNRLESPVSLCDTLPGSSDHNSQRMLIAPVGGSYYLFYAGGDMGAGQFGNHMRTLKAQWLNSYEGKIMRFNLMPDGDAGTLNRWIPNDNPYNETLGVQSAVWATGIRNNQGFAYDPVLDKLYGSSHGPFSDDEINIIERDKNYGHPLVIGYSWDNNANGTTAGAAPGMNPAHPSSCPMITSESGNAAAITNYKNPLFSAYPNSERFPSLNDLWNTTPIPNNGEWPSEGWSGLDLYTNSMIPGWKRSLVAASLKWGRLVKLRLNSTGDTVIKTGGYDTVSYFGSINRYRDLAFAPNGRDVFVIMDKNTSTSGPSAAFPVVPACAGCLQKYTFLGYTADPANGNRSSIPNSIDIAPGKNNVFEKANRVVINAAHENNNLWVPITDTNSNIVAEINARGQNLDTVTTYLFSRNGVSRTKLGKKYLNRNITISPQKQPAGPVWIRLYISKAEYEAFLADGYSGSIAGLSILKNSDSCLTSITANAELVVPSVAESFGADNGYVLQGEITGFSSFYFSNSHITLPVDLVSFKATLQNNATFLQWETANELNTSHFDVERSLDGRSFDVIGNVKAVGSNANLYSHMDYEVNNLSATVIYYRLKMVDNDGRYTYSSIVSVNLGDITNRVILSPNPTTGDTRLIVASEKEGTAVWKLTDNNGREVLRHSINIRKGNNNILLNLRGLKNGLYYLQVTGAGLNQNLKLQKL